MPRPPAGQQEQMLYDLYQMPGPSFCAYPWRTRTIGKCARGDIAMRYDARRALMPINARFAGPSRLHVRWRPRVRGKSRPGKKKTPTEALLAFARWGTRDWGAGNSCQALRGDQERCMAHCWPERYRCSCGIAGRADFEIDASCWP